MTPPKLFLFFSYSNVLTIATLLAGLPQSLVGKLQSPKLCNPSCSPCTSTSSHHSNTRTTSLVARHSPNFLQDCMSLFQRHHLPASRLIPLTCSLLLDLFAPVPIPASSKFHSYRCKTKGDRASSYFGPAVWNSLPLHIRNAATIDTFQSAIKTSLQTPRIWSALICLIFCVCGVCVLDDRKGGGEREGVRGVCNKCDCASLYWCIFMQRLKNICAIIFVTPSPLPLHVFF